MRSLNELKINEESIIVSVNTDINIKRRLMDIGFVKGEKVKLILKNFGDNMRAYKIKNTVMALRVNDTKNILIKQEKFKKLFFFLYKKIYFYKIFVKILLDKLFLLIG